MIRIDSQTHSVWALGVGIKLKHSCVACTHVSCASNLNRKLKTQSEMGKSDGDAVVTVVVWRAQNVHDKLNKGISVCI